jgi:hypothetical protein
MLASTLETGGWSCALRLALLAEHHNFTCANPWMLTPVPPDSMMHPHPGFLVVAVWRGRGKSILARRIYGPRSHDVIGARTPSSAAQAAPSGAVATNWPRKEEDQTDRRGRSSFTATREEVWCAGPAESATRACPVARGAAAGERDCFMGQAEDKMAHVGKWALFIIFFIYSCFRFPFLFIQILIFEFQTWFADCSLIILHN